MENERRIRPPAPRPGGEPPPSGPATTDAALEAARYSRVRVIWGAATHEFDIAGLNVPHARQLIEKLLNIGSAPLLLVNGKAPGAQQQLHAGDIMEFVHHAGEKGHCHGRAS